MKIILNGEERKLDRIITYEEICEYAGYSSDSAVSVTWKVPKINRNGMLMKGGRVIYKKGMVFNAMITGNA